VNISISTIAFKGYGKFLPQWLRAVSAMTPQPSEIVVTLGYKHNTPNLAQLKEDYPKVKFYELQERPSFGKLRNFGISHTVSEWVFFVSVDDTPEPDAIETFERALSGRNGDYICAQYYREGFCPGKYSSPLPVEMAENLKKGDYAGFIIPHSPFKRWLWEKHPYKETDLPNYDFVKNCFLSRARFIKADKPSTIYKTRPKSHSRTILKRNSIMVQARSEQSKFHNAILERYA